MISNELQELIDQILNINDTFIHTMISGTPGAGKSNLLKVAVIEMLQRYRPEEIELYLVDYKYGTDFSEFGNVELPQIHMLGLGYEPAYAHLILDEIERECERRAGYISEDSQIDKYNRTYRLYL